MTKTPLYRTYGFIAPWIAIAAMATIWAFLLLSDWKLLRCFFYHVTNPKELIRSETPEQMRRRYSYIYSAYRTMVSTLTPSPSSPTV